jgi:SAM-dependent methyltransferase
MLGRSLKAVYRIVRGHEAASNATELKLQKKEKSERKKTAFFTEAWDHSPEIVSVRKYESYERYVAHQVSKLTVTQSTLLEKEDERLRSFLERFRSCDGLDECHTVLCLGARLGTEVKALIQLGHFAIGIDLNPGPENCYVLRGDFHKLVFADCSVDAVYSNCLDHTLMLEHLCAEIRRVVRPNGIAVLDIYKGYEEGQFAGAFESMHWPTSRAFAEAVARGSGFSLVSIRSLADFGESIFDQVVLRKHDRADPLGDAAPIRSRNP